MVSAIEKELRYFGSGGHEDFFVNEPLNTLYFGGGTPSVLSVKQLERIMKTVYECYTFDNTTEITLEANPDDLTPEHCLALKQLGINRLSIGIQSFFEPHLRWMNRSHNETQALESIHNALNAGIYMINADLIYGFDGLDDSQWMANLKTLNDLNIQHASCYSLTLEEKTPMHKLVQTGRYRKPEDSDSARQFGLLSGWAESNGWEHYEISNFCRKGQYSKHNTAYWSGAKYLGIGPSAHTYNGMHRRWNVRDNARYIASWNNQQPDFTLEILGMRERVNEYIMTSLRTMWGLNLHHASGLTGLDFYALRKTTISELEMEGMGEMLKNHLILTRKGKLFADGIAAGLFVEEHELVRN